MNSNFDISQIYLSHSEFKTLKNIKRNRRLRVADGIEKLKSLKLIYENTSSTPGDMPVGIGTFEISDSGKSYLIYRKEKLFEKKLPVVISVIALIGAYRYELLWLLQAIAQLLKNIMGILGAYL